MFRGSKKDQTLISICSFQSGFESLKEELGPSRESTLPRQQAISEKEEEEEGEEEGHKLAAEEKITEKMSFKQHHFETGKNL
jgi:hypothetical protein